MSTYSGAGKGCWEFKATDGAKFGLFDTQQEFYTYIGAGNSNSQCNANPSLPIKAGSGAVPAIQVS